VFKFLRRAHFRKRRITSHLEANVPSTTEVRKRMAEIQKVIDDNKIPPKRVFNEDETGINWAPEMKYQYVPDNAQRGEAPPGMNQVDSRLCWELTEKGICCHCSW